MLLQILRPKPPILNLDRLGRAQLVPKFQVADGVGCHTPRHLRLNLRHAPGLTGGLKRCSVDSRLRALPNFVAFITTARIISDLILPPPPRITSLVARLPVPRSHLGVLLAASRRPF